ncbi:hypothetical protein J6T21_03010 [Candidatus Saccharibacteria bacterium]|nr:hypothetical protein [Candidatus Saccharibacteria bacterium]
MTSTEKEYACDTKQIHRSIIESVSELNYLEGINEFDQLVDLVGTDDSIFKQDSSGSWLEALNKVNALLKSKEITNHERDQLILIRRKILEYCDLISDE